MRPVNKFHIQSVFEVTCRRHDTYRCDPYHQQRLAALMGLRKNYSGSCCARFSSLAAFFAAFLSAFSANFSSTFACALAIAWASLLVLGLKLVYLSTIRVFSTVRLLSVLGSRSNWVKLKSPLAERILVRVSLPIWSQSIHTFLLALCMRRAYHNDSRSPSTSRSP
jgi:hypothetical protein